MRLYFGSYAFDENDCAVAISFTRTFNDAQQCYEIIHNWNVSGALHAADQNAVIAACATMEQALSLENQDLVLYGNDGSTVANALRNAGSTTGVRITNLSYPNGEGAELTTYRSYQFTATATYFFNGTTDGYRAFSETIQTSGGGPLWAVVETVEGLPERQKIRNYTMYRATQSGQAIGKLSRPLPPNPLWPGALVRAGNFGQQSPKWSGVMFQDFGVSWNYEFESPFPLVGQPNQWPV